MGRYETPAQVAKALGIPTTEAASAMNRADLHGTLSDADLKEIASHLGRPVRKPRDPFEKAFLNAYHESLRRSNEHQADTVAIRRELFGQMDIPLRVEVAEIWARGEAVRLGKEVSAVKWDAFGQSLVPFADIKEAETWIAQEVERQGGPLPEDIDYSGRLSPYELFREGKRMSWSSALRWQGDDGMDHSCWVAKDGALDRLRVASEELAQKIGCPVPRATTHILTGEVPVVPLVEPRTIWRGSNLAGINLQVNYPWVPAEVVQFYYTECKKVWTQPGPYQMAKQRRPSPKGAEVRAFVEARPRLSWPEKWRKWNDLHPGQQYSSWEGFRAVARRVTS